MLGAAAHEHTCGGAPRIRYGAPSTSMYTPGRKSLLEIEAARTWSEPRPGRASRGEHPAKKLANTLADIANAQTVTETDSCCPHE